MKKLISILIIFFFYFTNHALSIEKIVYLDLDYILSNSNKGKKILLNLEKINKQNLNNLKSKEYLLIKEEKDLLKQKNIISTEAYNEKVKKIKEKINLFRLEKNQLANNYKKEREQKINQFINLVDKILKEYVTNNSIDLVFNKKDILIGKNSYNITNDILKKVNELK